MMCRPMQPITLLATRAPCTAACWPRPWCCSFLQRHRTAVRLCSVQGCNSAKNISKYVETRTTLTARGCSPSEKGIQHHSGGMLFPRLSLHANTRACPNGPKPMEECKSQPSGHQLRNGKHRENRTITARVPMWPDCKPIQCPRTSLSLQSA